MSTRRKRLTRRTLLAGAGIAGCCLLGGGAAVGPSHLGDPGRNDLARTGHPVIALDCPQIPPGMIASTRTRIVQDVLIAVG